MPDLPSQAACCVAEALRDAVAIVLLQDDKVLLIRRAACVPRPGIWSAPTGRVEAGESAAAAVTREAHEELGIEIEPLREVWRSRTDDGRYQLAWWLVRHRGGTLQANPAEVAELRWVNSAEFFTLAPTFPQHRPFFEDILPRLLASAPSQA